MDAPKLVKMANEIAVFFEAEPDHAVVLQSVAGHLKRFWDPRMRRALVLWVDEHGGEGLRPSALEAIQTNRDALVPPPSGERAS